MVVMIYELRNWLYPESGKKFLEDRRCVVGYVMLEAEAEACC